MKPVQIKDPNKVYTKEELQKDSPYPLFESFHIGENPEDLSIYNNYINSKNLPNNQYYPLEKKYIEYLPAYMQIFAKEILIGPKDDVQIVMDFTEEAMMAFRLHHRLKSTPSNKEIIKLIKKDVDEFYKKFGATRAIRALQ